MKYRRNLDGKIVEILNRIAAGMCNITLGKTFVVYKYSEEELQLIKRHYILERLAEKKEPELTESINVDINQLTLELC